MQTEKEFKRLTIGKKVFAKLNEMNEHHALKNGHFPDFPENQPRTCETFFRRNKRSCDQKIVQTAEEFKRLTTG